MRISVPREITEGEHRVALVPVLVKQLSGSGFSVSVESGAGERASFTDEQYAAAGARVVGGAAEAWDSDLVVKINKPTPDEVEFLKQGSALVGLLQPLISAELVRQLAHGKVTSFSLDVLPRISRAQSMDVLSSMSTIAGYKAVLIGAAQLGKIFPMLVTAAGTVPPSRVLVLGAGVAGLQAIATARRLGAVVQAFDVRSAVREQIESLGAEFIAPEAVSEKAEDAGGYATELSEEQHRRVLELIHENIVKADLVITTALVPGKTAPVLITREMVSDMLPGSVIVDLASEAGGNCELTTPGQTIVAEGVTIMGPTNLPSSVPVHASQMFSRNAATFIRHLAPEGSLALDFDDEITRGTCITHEGKIVHEAVLQAQEGGR